MPSVYQTERPFSNLASGPKIGVHFTFADAIHKLHVLRAQCNKQLSLGEKIHDPG